MADITELARERLKKIKSWRETYGAGSNVILPAEEAEALARAWYWTQWTETRYAKSTPSGHK